MLTIKLYIFLNLSFVLFMCRLYLPMLKKYYKQFILSKIWDFKRNEEWVKPIGFKLIYFFFYKENEWSKSFGVKIIFDRKSVLIVSRYFEEVTL